MPGSSTDGAKDVPSARGLVQGEGGLCSWGYGGDSIGLPCFDDSELDQCSSNVKLHPQIPKCWAQMKKSTFPTWWLNFKAEPTETLEGSRERGWTPFKSSLFPMVGSWRECLPHPGHTSNSQPNATPISTQLGWRQNKLGIMHKCPELEPDMAQVFVFRKGSFEPEARTNFHTRFWAPEPCNSHVLLRES